MKSYLNPLAAVVALALAGPALADSQLATSAGLLPSEAAGLSLTEIAQAKFNRDSSASQQNAQAAQTASAESRARLAAAAGIAPDAASNLTLSEIAAVKFTRGSSDNNQVRPTGLGATVGTRSVDNHARSQLLSNAGLAAHEATDLTLSDIAAAKFARDNQ